MNHNSKTGVYDSRPEDGDDVYTVEEFLAHTRTGAFIDYDGYGHPMKGGKADPSIVIKPSKPESIPADATHILWYNR